MTPLLLAAVVAAAPVNKLAMPALTGVRISPDLVEFYGDHLAAGLRSQGLTVVTAKEIATALGLERQKQLLGCSDSATSCAAELAGALGVDGTVVGTLAKLDETWQLQLKVLAAADGRVLAGCRGSARSESELLARLDEAARTVASQLLPAPPPAPRSVRWYSWIPAAVGVAAVLGSGVLYLDAKGAHDELARPTGDFLPDARVAALVSQGNRSQTLSAATLGVGVAALAAAGAMFWFGASPDAVPTAWLAPHGAGFAISVRWP